MRRRLREQRRLREALLLDLGALVYELHRQGRRAPELLQQKAAELTVIDDEVRDLDEALRGGSDGPEVTEEVDAADYAEEDVEEDAPPDEAEPELEEPALAEHEEPRA